MKIVCTKKEFAKIVRCCETNMNNRGCGGCAFFGIVCGPEDDDILEECVDIEIEE